MQHRHWWTILWFLFSAFVLWISISLYFDRPADSPLLSPETIKIFLSCLVSSRFQSHFIVWYKLITFHFLKRLHRFCIQIYIINPFLFVFFFGRQRIHNRITVLYIILSSGCILIYSRLLCPTSPYRLCLVCVVLYHKKEPPSYNFFVYEFSSKIYMKKIRILKIIYEKGSISSIVALFYKLLLIQWLHTRKKFPPVTTRVYHLT